MKKILILLLLGVWVFAATAQPGMVNDQELEREKQATLMRITTALDEANVKLTKGDSEALAEIAALESNMAFFHIMSYGDYKSALPWVCSSVGRNADSATSRIKSDIAQSYTIMALFHENGWAEVPKSDSLAFCWYQKAAQGGDPQGMFRLGLFYQQGRGTAADDAKAFEWSLAAAQAECRDAYCPVAIGYYLGNGVKRDFAQAAIWAEKGREIGDGYCAFILGVIYCNGEGVKRDYAKCFELFTFAAEQGETSAYLGLSECYYYGRGVKRDYAQAQAWCQKGMDAEDETAATFMKKISRKIGR